MCSPKTLTRGAAVSAIAAFCLAFSAVASANPPTDPCGVVTEFAAAHAFGFRHARKTSVAVRSPGNSAGVVHVRCKLMVWNGHLPSGPRQQLLKLRDREMAILRVESWVPDQGGQAETWLANFPAKIHGLTERARSQFVGSPLHGSPLPLPKEGVPHALAFVADPAGLAKARAFWWDRRGTILSMNVLQGAGGSAIPSLRRFVADLVHPFFKG
ncbi:MAG: hypothetical protein JSS68_09200 [Actinobacteria bacterium]|nr:hypothetical protein [Actinomycetota bacterium]MBS1884704.1 hypothetical protein [Actinomycetota bacterium]